MTGGGTVGRPSGIPGGIVGAIPEVGSVELGNDVFGAVTLGTISMRKSYTSLSPTAACKSCRWRVLRRFRSVCLQARKDRSLIKSSQALLINTGASPEIINLTVGLSVSSWFSSEDFCCFSFSSS